MIWFLEQYFYLDLYYSNCCVTLIFICGYVQFIIISFNWCYITLVKIDLMDGDIQINFNFCKVNKINSWRFNIIFDFVYLYPLWNWIFTCDFRSLLIIQLGNITWRFLHTFVRKFIWNTCTRLPQNIVFTFTWLIWYLNV